MCSKERKRYEVENDGVREIKMEVGDIRKMTQERHVLGSMSSWSEGLGHCSARVSLMIYITRRQGWCHVHVWMRRRGGAHPERERETERERDEIDRQR
jgi:hypothetical protein